MCCSFSTTASYIHTHFASMLESEADRFVETGEEEEIFQNA